MLDAHILPQSIKEKLEYVLGVSVYLFCRLWAIQEDCALICMVAVPSQQQLQYPVVERSESGAPLTSMSPDTCTCFCLPLHMFMPEGMSTFSRNVHAAEMFARIHMIILFTTK